jgi:hypothetical protein
MNAIYTIGTEDEVFKTILVRTDPDQEMGFGAAFVRRDGDQEGFFLRGLPRYQRDLIRHALLSRTEELFGDMARIAARAVAAQSARVPLSLEMYLKFEVSKERTRILDASGAAYKPGDRGLRNWCSWRPERDHSTLAGKATTRQPALMAFFLAPHTFDDLDLACLRALFERAPDQR